MASQPRRNQHKSIPPLEDLEPHIRQYWQWRKTDVEILGLLLKHHINPETHGLGLTKFREMRSQLGLRRVRQQAHTVETIKHELVKLREVHPTAGAREMVSLLFDDYEISVSRHLVVDYFRQYEPNLLRQRKAGRLKRRRFWAAGVNDIIAVDQHDKWKRFGLALHTGVDPFCGFTHWNKVWWTNSNPKLILSYYIEMARKTSYIPLVTQSDPGSENYGIANAQTTLRHMHDPSLEGTIQHRWMRHKKNVMPEIAWSQLRRRFSPGYEDLLQLGVDEGWYDSSRSLDVLVFRWVFIPFLQKCLEKWTNRVNNTKKRADRNKVTPHGVPAEIYQYPDRFGCLDFKVKVSPDSIDRVESMYAPPSDPVFQLVPPLFDELANTFLDSMGRPDTTRDNVWDIYCELLTRFENLDNVEGHSEEWAVHVELMDLEPDHFEAQEQDASLIQGRELLGGMENANADGFYYMGGVNGGLGLDEDMIRQLDEMNGNDEFEMLEVAFSDEEPVDPEEVDDW